MKSTLERALGWIVAGVFVFGAYSIGHYLFKVSDGGMVAFFGFAIWSDMSGYLNRDDEKAP